jgi:cytochrome P450 monooxygenase-2
MSSRVFVGEELCRNTEWLQITENYTVDLFDGLLALHKYPTFLRPLLARILPEVRKVQGLYVEARDVIVPVIAKREEGKRAALAAGQPVPVFNDALGWLDQEAKARNCEYDVAICQLMLTVVAISTTADLLQSVLIDLIKHPEAIQPLRDEIVHILRAEGWKKSSIYNMKLLDSVIKETQRVKPINAGKRKFSRMDVMMLTKADDFLN